MDPAEGYKMARHVVCPTCDGGGGVSKSAFVTMVWKPMMKRYRIELDEWKKINSVKQAALKKLTPYEIAVLGLNRK